MYPSLQKKKRQFVGQDFLAQIEKLGERVEKGDEDSYTRNRDLHKAIKPFTDRKSKRKPRPKYAPLPELAVPDGDKATEPRDIPRAWARHTASVEFGSFTTKPELLRRNINRIKSRDDIPHVNHKNVPTPYDCEAYFARTKQYKAFDNAGIIGDILHLSPAAMSTVVHPLHFKSNTALQHPLDYKGGENVRLYKGSGDPSNPASSRSILLGDIIGKRLQSF